MVRGSAERTLRVVLSQVRTLAVRVAAVMLPNRCALCGNLSHAVICGACDAAYWNEAQLRCEVCALPLGVGHARSRGGSRSGTARAAAYRCETCRTAPPPFDATLALADYRAPLDGLARGLKFHARLALGGEFAARLARLVDDTRGAGASTSSRRCRCRTGGSSRAATTRRGRSRVRSRAGSACQRRQPCSRASPTPRRSRGSTGTHDATT